MRPADPEPTLRGNLGFRILKLRRLSKNVQKINEGKNISKWQSVSTLSPTTFHSVGQININQIPAVFGVVSVVLNYYFEVCTFEVINSNCTPLDAQKSLPRLSD